MSLQARKDPTIATLLSLCLPGAGYAYAGSPGTFVAILVLETALAVALAALPGGVVVLLLLHVFLAIAAGGAARRRNARLDDLPPPPPPAAARAAPPRPPAWSGAADTPPLLPAPPPAPAPSLPPLPSGPPLSADAFLAELRAAWSDHRAGTLDAAAFASRKRDAIDRVRTRDVDDGVALLEASASLVGAGVLTTEERARLKSVVGRP